MVIASIIALSGQYFGALLGKIAPEEFKPSELFYKIFRHLLLAALILFLLSQDFNLIAFIGGLLIGFYYRREYGYFGLIAVSAMYDTSFQIISSALIFLYGLPYGTLVYGQKKFLKLHFNSLWFILALGLGAFLTNFMAFTAGALITVLILNIVTDWKGEDAVPYWLRIGRKRSILEGARSL